VHKTEEAESMFTYFSAFDVLYTAQAVTEMKRSGIEVGTA